MTDKKCASCGEAAGSGQFCANCGAKLEGPIKEEAKEVTLKLNKRTLLIAGAAVLVLAGAVLVPITINAYNEMQAEAAAKAAEEARLAKQATFFKDAAMECSIADVVTIEPDGSAMFVDNMGEEEYFGVDDAGLFCVVDAVGTPSTVQDQMWSTTALMGIQSASWDGILATWSYHPDNGFDVNFAFEE